MQTEYLYVKLTALSPVHVGCAEVYEPTSFYINSQANELIHFETGTFIDMLELNDIKNVSEICKKGTTASILELMKFIYMRAVSMNVEGESVPVCSGLIQHYQQTMSIGLHDQKRVNKEVNRFEIKRTSYDPETYQPYLPGSAIKGAIRTAVLNYRKARVAGREYRGKNAARQLQQDILEYDFRRLESDPFRLLKVSDFFPSERVKRKIVYAVDKKKKPSKFSSRAPYQIFEIIEEGVEFWGVITVKAPVRPGIIKEPLTKKELIAALKTFYGNENKREQRELKEIGARPVKFKNIPIRIGRHSGAECVTVEGYRYIKIMQGRNQKPKYMDHATTVWLAADSRNPSNNSTLRPFGWMEFDIVSRDDLDRLQSSWEALRVQYLRHALETAQSFEEKLAIARQQQIEKQKREEEAKKLAADPVVQRKIKLEEFERGLPEPAKLASVAQNIMSQINKMDDKELQKEAILLVHKRFKDTVKKAKKKKKAWAISLSQMISEASN